MVLSARPSIFISLPQSFDLVQWLGICSLPEAPPLGIYTNILALTWGYKTFFCTKNFLMPDKYPGEWVGGISN